uniref:U296d n=1 Tax=Mycobacterium leprae TaxID=1769 RepID=Q50142_MYCLR|nr:u296d [Mycobacterium leprae]CAB08407.1 unknown [Mycobacterium leprae]
MDVSAGSLNTEFADQSSGTSNAPGAAVLRDKSQCRAYRPSLRYVRVSNQPLSSSAP